MFVAITAFRVSHSRQAESVCDAYRSYLIIRDKWLSGHISRDIDSVNENQDLRRTLKHVHADQRGPRWPTLKHDFPVIIHSAMFSSRTSSLLVGQCSNRVMWNAYKTGEIYERPTTNNSRHFGWNFRRNTPSLINNLLTCTSFSSLFSLFFLSLCRREKFFSLVIESNSITRNETCCSGISPTRQPQLLFQSITRSAADRTAESNTFHARRSMISTRESRSPAV